MIFFLEFQQTFSITIFNNSGDFTTFPLIFLYFGIHAYIFIKTTLSENKTYDTLE